MDNQEVANEFITVLKATDKEKPKPADLERLKQYLTDYPELAAYTGDFAAQAMFQVLRNAMPQQRGSRICADSFIEQMRDDLGYEKSSAVERSLIEHVCLCWLRLYATELRYELLMNGGDMSLAQGEYMEKKLSAHQRRYLRAIETLARVRRLMKDPPSPSLALLLKQQINVKR